MHVQYVTFREIALKSCFCGSVDIFCLPIFEFSMCLVDLVCRVMSRHNEFPHIGLLYLHVSYYTCTICASCYNVVAFSTLRICHCQCVTCLHLCHCQCVTLPALSLQLHAVVSEFETSKLELEQHHGKAHQRLVGEMTNRMASIKDDHTAQRRADVS